ncbi:hypothetical protein TELCIR_01332 [Teladorsagia circumcincta]|uniref:N-acetyltransferase domain-containing protein n=1 Tax=Teladorsagia circumcincta TaxID=45464 RepID=A0A2G9V4C9_TELCI|nr:hypothetical protein TELCIR_01332 [Teladorsagia circumcincta]
MEVAADLRPVLGPTLVRLDPMRIKQLQSPTVYKAIDDLAKLSAQCMQLRSPLTTCEKLVASDHTLYLSWEYDANFLLLYEYVTLRSLLSGAGQFFVRKTSHPEGKYSII